MSSKGYELVQLANGLTVDANGTITDLDIDTTNIDNLVNIDLAIAPEILEIQVSAPTAGQDTAWLWTWEQSTLPYARRTITNSPEVQVPLYKQGTYTVNNYAAYDIFGSMTQTHSLYLKWIDGAGTDNLVSWAVNASGNPISDSHPDINGGAATDVQRINVSVPATVTPPVLTAPSVSYTVANNGSGAYTFSGSAAGDNPNIGPFYRGGTYTINISATGHPLYFTTDNGTNFSAGTYFGEYTDGVTGSRTDSGTITFTVPNTAPDTLYYQCGNHSAMRGAITIKNLEVETNNNGNYILYFQHTQEGHKTPVEIRPIPSLVNQMCLVFDSNSGKFVPQDLATYVENTPSFENKIREVAGTAELVVEDGSTVVAKVNVYDDSTYLPLTGNNVGDQAFATDNNILYIWDGSTWQQAGAVNTDEITEGNNNLFYTDARVSAYLAANDFDTATNIVSSIVDSAPSTLDTLNELAAALGDDANFSTTITNQIGTKLSTADFTTTADTWLATKDTDDLTEGTNQYFTAARVQGTTIDAGSLRGTVNNARLQYGTSYSGTPTQGSFFFDSLNQKLKVYTGSAFVDAVPAGSGGGSGGSETSANATFRKYTYTISSSTNAVSGADDASETLSYVTDGTQNVEVYRNGVKLVEGASNDYVASTGTSVTFVNNLSSGDVVDIQVYELLTNDAYYLKTETYTRTETNTQISTALSGLVDSAPSTLDTLNELAAALGDDANFSTTVTNSIATKAPIDSPTFDTILKINNLSSYTGSADVAGHIRPTNRGSDTANSGLIIGGSQSSDFNHSIWLRIGNDDVKDVMDFYEYGQIRFFTGGTISSQAQRLVIDSVGNVGIGTTNPGDKLHIWRTDSDTYSESAISGGIKLIRRSNSGTANEAFGIELAATGWAGVTTGVAAINVVQPSNANSGDLTFQNRNAGTYQENLRIKADGKIGIGTNAPTTSLTVNGDMNLQAQSTGNSAKLYFGDEVTSGPGKAIFMEDYYIKIQGHRNEGIRLQGVNGVGEVQEFATFYGDANAKASQILFAPTSGGNVGIGTDNATNKLTINGGLTFNDGSGGYIHLGMDQRSSPVVGTNGAYIWSGSGSSGDYLAGALVLQSRANQNRNIEFVTGSTPSKRLTVYGSGDTHVHNNLMVGEKTKFIADPANPYDFELQTANTPGDGYNQVFTIQNNDEFKFWGNSGADEIFRIDNSATYKSQTFGTHNATGYAINSHSTWQVVNIQRYHMSTGNSTTISSTSGYTNVGNSISYTPKKAGNILVIEHGVLTWYGSTSNGSGDIYVRFLINGSQVWVNDRARGNFDADEQRSHHYLRSQFLYTTTGTSAITIQLQGSASGNVPGGFNFYHTTCDANQYIITEYEQ